MEVQEPAPEESEHDAEAPEPLADVEGAEAQAKAKARAVRHSAGTFAGRRPPNDPAKLEVFMKMKEIYYETRPDQPEGPQSKKRKGSTNQNQYYAFMQKEMAKLASAGVNGGERMKKAAEAWRAFRTVEGPAPEGTRDEAAAPAAPAAGLGSSVDVQEQSEPAAAEPAAGPGSLVEVQPDDSEVSWILFDGATSPVRLDRLTPLQEMQLENGKPHRFVPAPLLWVRLTPFLFLVCDGLWSLVLGPRDHGWLSLGAICAFNTGTGAMNLVLPAKVLLLQIRTWSMSFKKKSWATAFSHCIYSVWFV